MVRLWLNYAGVLLGKDLKSRLVVCHKTHISESYLT